MKWRTDITIEDYPFGLDYENKIFMIGSCFSDHIGSLLKRNKFNVWKNPHGVIFNPISIFNQMTYFLDPEILNENQLEENDGIWHHFDFHGQISGTDKFQVFQKLKVDIINSANFLRQADFLFITLGTANVYTRNSTGKIVANNHKFPIGEFKKQRLSTNEISLAFDQIKPRLFDLNPNLKIIFTVSPVRYLRDGLIENQRSKATLLLAIDSMEDNKNIFYFPAYEIFQDVLRDYRYYAEDMTHPSGPGVSYVWELFKDKFFNKETKTLQARIEKLVLSMEHRPIHPDSNNHQKFRIQLMKDCAQITEDYPFIDFSNQLLNLS